MNGREIERVWVLRAMPSLPPGAEIWVIEQGYLPGGLDEGDFREGRIRRIHRGDGSVVCVHTMKSGTGMVREETERPMDEREFERLWPATQGRRIEKTRHRVADGQLTWEVDDIRQPRLVMLEVELPDESTTVRVPTWAAPLVEREVTFDPRYRNAALAMHGVPD